MSEKYYEAVNAIAYNGKIIHKGCVAKLHDKIAKEHKNELKEVKLKESELDSLKKQGRLILDSIAVKKPRSKVAAAKTGDEKGLKKELDKANEAIKAAEKEAEKAKEEAEDAKKKLEEANDKLDKSKEDQII